MIKRKSDDMTVTIKSNTNDNYHVSLEMENRYGNDVYIVQVCPCIDDSICGYPEKEMIYSIADKKNAYATYNRYMKKYCN